jgi:hypothetical protein
MFSVGLCPHNGGPLWFIRYKINNVIDIPMPAYVKTAALHLNEDASPKKIPQVWM